MLSERNLAGSNRGHTQHQGLRLKRSQIGTPKERGTVVTPSVEDHGMQKTTPIKALGVNKRKEEVK